MIFQTLDDKRICPAIYVDGSVHRDVHPPGLTGTWHYSSFLDDLDVEYASLYCNGKTVEEVCPEDLRPRWNKVSKKLRAFLQFAFSDKAD